MRTLKGVSRVCLQEYDESYGMDNGSIMTGKVFTLNQVVKHFEVFSGCSTEGVIQKLGNESRVNHKAFFAFLGDQAIDELQNH